MDGGTLEAAAQKAAAGDRAAAEAVLAAIQDDLYELSLRMLGHPADAEDAAQEIAIVVLTHLGSFRAESAFTTWVYRIAVNQLLRARRGRKETFSFEQLGERLDSGLREEASPRPDPEALAMGTELRLRCTEGMLLSLDRELRIAHILGDLFALPGAVCAEVLGIAPAAFRKRLSRAREKLAAFLEGRCGLLAPANPCRCALQVDAMEARGLLGKDDLYLSRQPTRPPRPELERAAAEVGELVQLGELLRGGRAYAAPEALGGRLRALLDPERLALLRDAH
jgi:RNA polymerase sigma factor (sigma-70 family)